MLAPFTLSRLTGYRLRAYTCHRLSLADPRTDRGTKAQRTRVGSVWSGLAGLRDVAVGYPVAIVGNGYGCNYIEVPNNCQICLVWNRIPGKLNFRSTGPVNPIYSVQPY